VVYAEDHRIREFASLVAGAHAFLGPHGAGHANIAFMNAASACVAEMFGAHISREYWCISGGFGFNYFLLAADADASPPDVAQPPLSFLEKNGLDLSVSKDRFEKLLMQMAAH
jgi:hypothetical protein